MKAVRLTLCGLSLAGLAGCITSTLPNGSITQQIDPAVLEARLTATVNASEARTVAETAASEARIMARLDRLDAKVDGARQHGESS